MSTLIDQTESSHAFADRTDRFARDALLRKYGFRVSSRPNRGQAKWEKGGKLYTFGRALKEIPASLVNEAKKREEQYYEEVY